MFRSDGGNAGAEARIAAQVAIDTIPSQLSTDGAL
jgi:hypothetical protein